jgi:hypothetical protein
MSWRSRSYLLANAAAPVCAVGGVFTFAAGYFFFAWLCAFAVVVCMETRVHMGQRMRHTTLFWVHLLSAIPFFSLLSILAFVQGGLWLVAITALFGLVALGSGSVLWYRGLEARMLHLA